MDRRTLSWSEGGEALAKIEKVPRAGVKGVRGLGVEAKMLTCGGLGVL